MMGWNGKWIFTESGELVAPKMISKHDISVSIYGRIKADSIIFDLLGFKKTEEDKVDELEKIVPKELLDTYFKRKLWELCGKKPEELSPIGDPPPPGPILPFPSLNVKNWEALKKHAIEMLVYADPVKYEARVRSIRTSNHPKEAKAYLLNMYRYDGTYKYACQLCHESCSSFETTELFLKPETELDPINLCLCPKCATAYRGLRSDSSLMTALRNTILSKTEQDIRSEDHVAVAIDNDDELWFTQTHFAEIQELMKLADEVRNAKSATPVQPTADDEDEKSGLSVYKEYEGKTIRRNDNIEFEGIVAELSADDKGNHFLVVNMTKGKDAGTKKKFSLEFILSNPNKYYFEN